MPEWSDRGSTGVPWKVCWLIYREPPPPLVAWPCVSRVTFFRSFFCSFVDIVFNALLDRFWCQLAPNLASKIDQKSIQEPSKIYSKFHLVFDALLDWFLVDFWSNLGPRTLQKAWKTNGFLMFFWFRLFASWMAFGAYLAPFWEGFGSQVGAKLAANRSKNRSKNLSKKWYHFRSPLDRFLVDLGLQLRRPRGSNEPGFGAYVGSWSHLGAKMASRALQEDLGTDFGRFLNHFGRFLEQCWSIFEWFLEQFWMIV